MSSFVINPNQSNLESNTIYFCSKSSHYYYISTISISLLSLSNYTLN